MKELSPGLRRSEPVASFLQGSLIWITDYEELIDGRWQTFVSIHPRKIGHSPCEDDVPVDQLNLLWAHGSKLLGMKQVREQ
jgi:hypothetical protein